MITRDHTGPADLGAPRRWISEVGRFAATVGMTWLLTIAGGGACGLVCAGLASVAAFVLTVPAGMYGGVFLGLPLGVVLAVAFVLWANPPHDPVRFTTRVERVGKVLAVAVVTFLNAYLFVILVIGAGGTDARMWPLVVLQIPNAALAIGVAEVIGSECGRRLATGHLRRLGLPAPARRLLVTQRLHLRAQAAQARRGQR